MDTGLDKQGSARVATNSFARAKAVVNGAEVIAPAVEQKIPLIVTDIDRLTSRTEGLETLSYLIKSQAILHESSYSGNPDRLAASIKSRGNTFRGFVIQRADNYNPVAYAVYYPMIDANGVRAAYCEDFHIVSDVRGRGVARILFNQLAQRTMNEGFDYLEWTTDMRNEAVHGFVAHLGAEDSGIMTLDATKLLSAAKTSQLLPEEKQPRRTYATRLIKPDDMNAIAQMGFNSDIIRFTGDMNFKGFITYRRNAKDEELPVAITPGWKHLSTFTLKEGVTLEHPTIADGHDQQAVMFSIISAARDYCLDKENNYDRLRWHIHPARTDNVESILFNDYNVGVDTMLPGNAESRFALYMLYNGNLAKMAKGEVPLEMPARARIGATVANDHRNPPRPVGSRRVGGQSPVKRLSINGNS